MDNSKEEKQAFEARKVKIINLLSKRWVFTLVLITMNVLLIVLLYFFLKEINYLKVTDYCTLCEERQGLTCMNLKFVAQEILK